MKNTNSKEVEKHNMTTNNITRNKKVKILFFTGLLLLGSLTANAQLDLPNDDNPVIDDNPVPIDGFLTIGLLAGAFIGMRKRIKGLKE